MGIGDELSKRYVRRITEDEKKAATLFKQIDLYKFIQTTVENCLNESSRTATNELKNKLKYIKENYFKTDQDFEFYKWRQSIASSYRNDKTTYRQAVSYASDKSDNGDQRIRIVCKYIANHIDNLKSFREKMRFIEDFEQQVKISMSNEALFNHFKIREQEKPLPYNRAAKNESEPLLVQNRSYKQIIEKAFRFMLFDDPRKHKEIITEKEYDNLINWVTYFFDNEFKLPDVSFPIQVANTTKGNIIYTFKSLFKEICPTHTRPESFYQLINLCFYQLRDEKKSNIDKLKEPNYYSDLIRKTALK